MAEKPAVLISDDLVDHLSNHSICDVSFKELTGTQHPWDVDMNIFQEIKVKFDQIEKALRSANPELDITCVLSGHSAFWQSRDGLKVFLDKIESEKKAEQDGPSPIWKLTSAEIFASHISNMRQLILAAAHDQVLLNHLKDPLGNNHLMLQREFEHGERNVRILLDDISEQGINLEFTTSKDIILLERIRITQDMLAHNKISINDLGYSQQELQHVQAILEKRVEKEFPKFRRRLNGAYNQIKESLHNGECTNLRRISHWEMAFALIGNPPIGYRGQSDLTTVEREKMTAIVASREDELGPTEEGQSSLVAAEESRQAVKPKSAPPAPQPVEEPQEEPQEEQPVVSAQRKKTKPRMAIIDRLRR